MSDENTITDEQVEQFFATGGEALPEGLEDISDEGDAQEIAQEPEQKQEVTDEKEAKSDPLSALEQERDNYKKGMEAERVQRKELRQELQALQNELKSLKENSAPKNNEAPKVDFDENPLEALKAQQDEILKNQSKIDSHFKSEEERIAAQQEFNEFAQSVKVKTQEFANVKPDYYDAYKYLVDSRVNELKIQGVSEKEIQKIIGQDELSISFSAMNDGRNPAEIVYELAKHRGYASKLQEKIDSASAQLDRIEKGSSLSKSLGTGNNVSVDLSLESIAAMNDAELDAFLADDENWEKVMGSR